MVTLPLFFLLALPSLIFSANRCTPQRLRFIFSSNIFQFHHILRFASIHSMPTHPIQAFFMSFYRIQYLIFKGFFRFNPISFDKFLPFLLVKKQISILMLFSVLRCTKSRRIINLEFLLYFCTKMLLAQRKL